MEKGMGEDGPGASTTRVAGGDRDMGADTGPDDAGGARAEAELRALLGRAERGDRSVLPALRALLDARPGLWRTCGDIAGAAESAWIGVVAGDDLLVGKSLARRVAELKAELGGPSPTPLERLLADRVVLCWIQCSQADTALIGARGKGLTAAQLALMERRAERVGRSYLAAIKALVDVRKVQPAASVVADVGAGTAGASDTSSDRDMPRHEPRSSRLGAPVLVVASGSGPGGVPGSPTRKFSIVKEEE